MWVYVSSVGLSMGRMEVLSLVAQDGAPNDKLKISKDKHAHSAT